MKHRVVLGPFMEQEHVPKRRNMLCFQSNSWSLILRNFKKKVCFRVVLEKQMAQQSQASPRQRNCRVALGSM